MSPGVFLWKELPTWQNWSSTPKFRFTPPHFQFSLWSLPYINLFYLFYFIKIKTHTHTKSLLSLHPRRNLHHVRQQQQFPAVAVAGIFSGDFFSCRFDRSVNSYHFWKLWALGSHHNTTHAPRPPLSPPQRHHHHLSPSFLLDKTPHAPSSSPFYDYFANPNFCNF